jgi:bla regulator protein blaR1
MSRTLLGVLADTSLRASVAAVLVAGVLAALQVRTSAARHSSWTAVLCSMLLMPVLPYSIPAIALPFSVSVSWLPASTSIGPLVAPHYVQRIEPSPGSDRTAVAVPLAASRAEESGTVEVGASEYRSEDPNHPSPPRWPLAVLIGYSVVTATLLMRFAIGWWGAARIVRISERIRPAPESLAVIRSRGDLRIRESRLVSAPVTVGVLAPTILLPVTWRRWSAAKLRAVLAHEVAHVHRRDPLVAFMARLNRCLLWFHPLSWWLERTLAATAEQASDDIAVSAVGEPAIYAEILLDMARAVSRGRGRLSRLGVGIDGSGLLQQRIDRVLAFEPVREMSARYKGVLALTCLSAILFAAACQPSSASPGTPARATDGIRHPAFETASVKRNTSVDWWGGPGFESPSGVFAATNMTLRTLITFAYGTPDFRISGGPSWMASDRFDVLAQTAGDVDDPFAVPATHGPGRVQSMMQTLLAERFKLTVHHETQDLPVLALMTRSDGRVGPHLRKVELDCAPFWAGVPARGGPPRAPRPGERLACIIDNEADRIASGGGTLSQMAGALSMRMHRVVLDRTGLTGTFDFDLEWTPPFDPLAADRPPAGAAAGRGPDSGSSIVTAVQEQLGLKLEAGRGPVDVLRIDRAEHPVED